MVHQFVARVCRIRGSEDTACGDDAEAKDRKHDVVESMEADYILLIWLYSERSKACYELSNY